PANPNVPLAPPRGSLGPREPSLDRADFIRTAGAKVPWHPPHLPLRAGCRVIHLEEDPLRPRSAYWGYRTTHAVAGDRRFNLEALWERVRRKRPSPPAERAERWRHHKARAVERGRRDADLALAKARDAVPAAELFRALHRALPA